MFKLKVINKKIGLIGLEKNLNLKFFMIEQFITVEVISIVDV